MVQDAAHSMAAVGMLAPFVESIFFQSFVQIGEIYQKSNKTLPTHPRWKNSSSKRWDCHFVWNTTGKQNWRKDLSVGIQQMAEEIRLTPRLPLNLARILEALFSYRNSMFHNGFEWPEKERRDFQEKIQKHGWSDWFHYATHEGKPWVFYMTKSFISVCLSTIQKVIQALGEFSRHDLDHSTS